MRPKACVWALNPLPPFVSVNQSEALTRFVMATRTDDAEERKTLARSRLPGACEVHSGCEGGCRGFCEVAKIESQLAGD